MSNNNVKFDATNEVLETSKEIIEESKELMRELIGDLIKENGIGSIDPKMGMMLIKAINLGDKLNKLSEAFFKASEESIENQKLMDEKLNRILEKLDK